MKDAVQGNIGHSARRAFDVFSVPLSARSGKVVEDGRSWSLFAGDCSVLEVIDGN